MGNRKKIRRIICILLAAAVLVAQLIIPGMPGTVSARAAETSAVTTASAGNAADGVKVTHSVSMPKLGDKTAEITIELQSDLQVKKHTDTVFCLTARQWRIWKSKREWSRRSHRSC